MAKKNPDYAVMVLVARDHIEELAKRHKEGVEGRMTFAVYGATQSSPMPILSLLSVDDNRNTIAINDIRLASAVPDHVLGDAVPVIVTAQGPTVDRDYRDIIEAAGIDPSALRRPQTTRWDPDLTTRQAADHIAATAPAGSLLRGPLSDLEPDDEVDQAAEEDVHLVAIWSASRVHVPLVVATAESRGLALDLARRARAAIPPFVREHTMVVPAPGPLRVPLIIGHEEGGIGTAHVPVPNRHVVVLGDGEERNATGTTATTLTKVPAARFDGRKISRAIACGGEHIPVVSELLATVLGTDASEASAEPPDEDVRDDELLDVSDGVLERDERIAALEKHLAEERSSRERAQRDLADARREAAAVHRELARLAGEDSSVAVAEASAPESVDEAAPSAWDAALARYDELVAMDVPAEMHEVVAMAREHLVRVGLPSSVDESALELDAHGRRDRAWTERAWRLLAAMEAFAMAATDPRRADFRSYCSTIPHPPISPKQIAMKESQTTSTHRRLRAARLFDVDPAFSRSGKATMMAHARVAADGSPPAPRMYFMDDTRGATGKVHVGYLGVHLENASTT